MTTTTIQWAIALALILIAAQAFASDLPNPSLTPGAINTNITQENIHSTICVKGYTKTVRPPASYTNKLKKKQIRQYGYADTNPKHYIEDHLIAIEIGGSPDDQRNLWPEPLISEWNAKKKDKLENVLHEIVCAGDMSLADAQHELATDWIYAWKKYVPSHSHKFKGKVD